MDEGAKADSLVRFYSQAIELAEGAKQTWVTITRTGDFSDPRYGDFKITPTLVDEILALQAEVAALRVLTGSVGRR